MAMNLESYNKLVDKELKLYDKFQEILRQREDLAKEVAKARKEIRNQVVSTYQKGKTSAVMQFNGRVLKMRINQRGDSVTVTENGNPVYRGWFRNGYEAEFAFATGQI